MARCRWHFGGGPDYCAACDAECATCPYREHEPQTIEGWETWDVVLRCASQLRLAPGTVIGLDFGVCITIGEALGYDTTALAALLPAAEAGMVAAMNSMVSTTDEEDAAS